MKRFIIFSLLFVFLAGTFTMQSCKNDDMPQPKSKGAPMPKSPTPANSGVVELKGTAYTLKWEGSDVDGDNLVWDVYLSDNPADLEFVGKTNVISTVARVAKGVSGNSYTATIAHGGHYYWRVATVDAMGIICFSPVWEFVVNSAPSIPVNYAPANDATAVSAKTVLSWESEDAEHNSVTYKIYLGTTTSPGLYAEVEDETELAVKLNGNTTYYWKVVAVDEFGFKSEGTVAKFTTANYEVIDELVGKYDVEEAANVGPYEYVNSFSKVNSTQLQCDNFWDAGGVVPFDLDFTANTIITSQGKSWLFYQSSTSKYYANVTGTFDIKTRTIEYDYVVIKVTIATGAQSVAEYGHETLTPSSKKSLSSRPFGNRILD